MGPSEQTDGGGQSAWTRSFLTAAGELQELKRAAANRFVVEPARRILRPEGPRVSGRFLTVNGERFWVKGVTYGTFRPNADGEPFPERAQVREDLRGCARSA